MLRLAGALFPAFPLLPAQALQIVTAAFEAGDIGYGITDAVTWAREAGWSGIPLAALEADAADFEAADFDFDSLVRRRLSTIARDRLSPDRLVPAPMSTLRTRNMLGC
jgi:hypothetical protein